MKNLFVSIVFHLCTIGCFAQNLVANGGFEEKNVCTEFKVTCAPEAWFRVPWAEVYGDKPQNIPAFSGQYFQTIAVENFIHPVTYRSFIYTKLLCPLTKDTTYVFSLWINTFNNGFDHLDIWLPEIEPIRTKKALNQITPEITCTQQHKSASRMDGWAEITYRYTATGTERFLMIGNFSKEPMFSAERTSKNGDVLYAFDEVSVRAVNRFAPCDEIEASRKQLFGMNHRHTSKIFIDDVPLQKSLIQPQPLPPETTPIKTGQPVYADTTMVSTQPVAINDTLILPDILFRFNSNNINPAFASLLDSVWQKIALSGYRQIEIAGHTDNIGSPSYNIQLSLNRAKSVSNYFIQQKKLSPASIKVIGKGEAYPIDINTTPEGRQHNRRVEIILVK